MLVKKSADSRPLKALQLFHNKTQKNNLGIRRLMLAVSKITKNNLPELAQAKALLESLGENSHYQNFFTAALVLICQNRKSLPTTNFSLSQIAGFCRNYANKNSFQNFIETPAEKKAFLDALLNAIGEPTIEEFAKSLTMALGRSSQTLTRLVISQEGWGTTSFGGKNENKGIIPLFLLSAMKKQKISFILILSDTSRIETFIERLIHPQLPFLNEGDASDQFYAYLPPHQIMVGATDKLGARFIRVEDYPYCTFTSHPFH